MKKLLFVLLSAFIIMSCKKDDNPGEITFIGEWNTTSLLIDDEERIVGTGEGLIYTFAADSTGTVLYTYPDDNPYTEEFTWTFEEDSNTLLLTQSDVFVSPMKIISLSEQDMILDNNGNIYTMRRN
ncbi:lipocalin family protein [Sphingobacterium gobiense]|uniref:Lipocalin-like domain-containing protein n=1 Tax=Sphingobacterium gobiense TaxID=1382456 RepID=A0A2S9JNJ3_9SPHI|nr:lipocalin family protein [Sphingobacterium gobiense]PRD54678.1 hypothetical protein C5749_14690 [Sphingobacterium gobiense]